MPAIDIFGSTFRLAPKVCILAPGPNGRGCYGTIPEGYEVIAVSKAALIEEVPRKRVWVMCHGDQAWFDLANAAFRGVRVFSDDALREAEGRLDPEEMIYYFRLPPDSMEAETVDRVDGAIRAGGTVAGCALQLAYNFGAREILLCGVDMSGDDYWDGTHNVNIYHGEVWNAVPTLNRLIRWLGEDRGVRVATLSETRLDVPAYRTTG